MLTDTKDAAKNSSKPKSKGKDMEKVAAMAAVDQCEPEKSKEHVTTANMSVGKIYDYGDSDEEVLDWDFADAY